MMMPRGSQLQADGDSHKGVLLFANLKCELCDFVFLFKQEAVADNRKHTYADNPVGHSDSAHNSPPCSSRNGSL